MSVEAEKLLATGDLVGFLAQVRRDKATARQAIGDVSGGAILANQARTRWAFLLPDMTTAGKWRLQRFDDRGFSGHAIFDTQEDLVDTAISDGYTTPDPGALDALQDTPRFQRGNFLTELVGQVNARQLSQDDADRLLAAYDARCAIQANVTPAAKLQA